MLDVLGSKQIPVIAIFLAKTPNHPKVFRGSYTQEEILGALGIATRSSPWTAAAITGVIVLLLLVAALVFWLLRPRPHTPN